MAVYNYKRHIFVCINQRPPDDPQGCCREKGSLQTFQRFRVELEKRNLLEDIGLAGTTCLGPCPTGPSVVVYPEAVWYGKVKPEEVEEIVEKHIARGNPIDRLFVDKLMKEME
ncbi:MAG: ferredoxin [Candidatus Binatia bacterium]